MDASKVRLLSAIYFRRFFGIFIVEHQQIVKHTAFREMYTGNMMDTSNLDYKETNEEYTPEERLYGDIYNRAIEETDKLMLAIQEFQQRRSLLEGSLDDEKYQSMAIKEADIELLADVNAFYVALLKTL